MPINRYLLILLALLTLLAVIALQLNSAAAQQPAGITLTPTDGQQTATATESQVTESPTEPVVTDTPIPTGEITIPPPFGTDTPTPEESTPEESSDRAKETPPVLPATGQSPIGGGFPIEGLFAVVVLALVGWFILRGMTGTRTHK